MYIRFFATTDEQSPVSQLALEYLRSLVRIAPVRVIDPARMGPAIHDGAWARYDALFHTPMFGQMVNVVCTAPSRWTWLHTIRAPKTDDPKAELETISDRLELYTADVRNVLICATRSGWTFPLSAAELETAKKYQAVITPIESEFIRHIGEIVRIPVPVKDHAAFRDAVLGPTPK